MRIDDFAAFHGVYPSETRLMALLAIVGQTLPGDELPPPLFESGVTHVYAFPLASRAVTSAINSVTSHGKTVAAVWLGELGPDAQQLEAKIRRAIACAGFGEPGQVVFTLAAAETARELLPEGARLVELGNRRTGDEIVERLFVIEASRRAHSMVAGVGERGASLRFIGRSREVSELEDRITRYRLVTVSGPAGVGKTTLVRRVLDEMDPLSSSWYLDATSLAGPALLPAALTGTLEIRKEPLQTHIEALLQGAAEMDGVLAIDAGARELSEIRLLVRQLLAVAPNLAIVVVAPRPLRLPSESVLALRGLEYPKTPASWHSLEEYDAVQFFESRAAAVVPNFALTERDVETVAIICQRLEGNPAALTLAVNKLKALSPRQILDRLNQPLEFLKGAAEHMHERHQSLQTMIGVTVAPLSDTAKSLLGCLALLDGAAGMDDIEAMFPRHASLRAFEDLIDAGLLDPCGAGFDVKRFTMAPSTRAFARLSLDAKEREAVEERRLAYFERVALQSASGLAGKDQMAWTRRMEEQCPDISSTVRVLTKRGEAERATIMLVSGLTFWFERNFPSEALALAEAVLRRKPNFPSRARLENFAAIMAHRLGDVNTAEAYAKRGLERAIASRNLQFQFFLYGTLGNIYQTINRFEEGERYQRKAIEIARKCGENQRAHTAITNLLANLFAKENCSGTVRDYSELVREALSLESEETSSSWKSRLRQNIANAELVLGNPVRCKAFCREALELLRESGHLVSAAGTVRTLAHALIRQSRFAEAASLFGAAQALVESDEGRLTDYERVLTEEGIRTIVEAIGQSEFGSYFDAGRLLDAEEVFEYAISCARP